MSEAEEAESVDVVLDRLEAIIARLAESREPIESLVGAYEEGIDLAGVSGERLAALARRAGLTPS